MKEGTTWTDQELDALFQDAAAHESIPPFQDAYWTEMEAMLPTKKKRVGFIWWGAASLLIISLGVTGAVLLTDSDPNTQVQQAAKQSVDSKTKTDENNSQIAAADEVAITNNTTVVESAVVETNGSDKRNPVVQPQVVQSGLGSDHVSFGTAPLKKEDDSETAVLNAKEPLFTSPKTLNAVGGSKYDTGIPLYAEIGLGFGQSYRTVQYASNWMPQIRVGAGLYREIGNMELNAGLAFRAELPDNITYEMTSPGLAYDTRVRTDIKRLYSVEFPLFMGGKFGRSTLGATMIPGIQMRYSGLQTVYIDEMLKSRNEVSGRRFESKTMTMEMGARYTYSLNENVQLTSSFTLDVVRPFQSEEFLGEVKQYPATFFVGLKRTF